MRKFVQRSAAKKAAYTRDSGIIVNLLFALPLRQLIGSHVFLRVLVSVRDHGAEFEDIDRLSTLTNSFLTEERLSGRVNLNSDACSYNGDGQHRADRSRKNDVESSLEGKIGSPTFLGGGSLRICGGSPIASRRHETLRWSRVLDGRWKFRRRMSLRGFLPIHGLINQCRTNGRIRFTFCIIQHVLSQHFVPGSGILPVLCSDHQQLGDRLFEVSHHPLLV